jgi:hypothetical protein
LTAGPRGNHVEYTNLELLKVVEGNVAGQLRRIRRDTRLELVPLEGEGDLPGGRLLADPGDPPEALDAAADLPLGPGSSTLIRTGAPTKGLTSGDPASPKTASKPERLMLRVTPAISLKDRSGEEIRQLNCTS